MSVVKSTFVVSSFTFISRVFGFCRDVFVAKYLGAGIYADCFFAAFKLPNLFRQLFAEGALSASFIPIFSEKVVDKGHTEAVEFARSVFSILLYTLLIVTLVVEIFMPYLIKTILPGFANDYIKFSLTVSLSRITFFYLIFIALSFILAAVLNTFQKFFYYSAMPIILNVTLIFFVIFLGKFFKNTAYTLAFGVTISGIIQIAFVFFGCIKNGALIYPVIPKMSDSIKLFFKRLLPGIVGSGVMQLNVFFDILFASLFPSAVSYLYYADRVNQLPLALIGTAIGIVLLPVLSKKIKQHKMGESLKIQKMSLEISMLLAIPATFILFFYTDLIVYTLFERGSFTSDNTTGVARVLQIFSLGLPFFILVKIYAPCFFARGDTKTPMFIGIVCLFVNIIINLSLYKVIGYLCISVSTTTAAVINVLLLIFFLNKADFLFVNKDTAYRITKIVIASIAMCIVVNYSRIIIMAVLPNLNRFISLFVILIAGILTYFSIILLTKTFGKGMFKPFFKSRSIVT